VSVSKVYRKSNCGKKNEGYLDKLQQSNRYKFYQQYLDEDPIEDFHDLLIKDLNYQIND
jgi:hypothetical protein